MKLVANDFLYMAKSQLTADCDNQTWLFIACFREIQKSLQDCKALYPRLELSRATCSVGGAVGLKVRLFFHFNS